jgi:predicted small secreted protein
MYTKTIAAIFAALTLFLSGCNTIKGIGQDVQKAGTAIENATKK